MASGKKSVGSVGDDSSSDEELSVTDFRTLIIEKCAEYEQSYDPVLAEFKKERRYEVKILLPNVRSPRPYPVAGPLELPPRRSRSQSSNLTDMKVEEANQGIDAPTCPIADCAMKINRSMLLWHYMNSHSDFQLYEVQNEVPFTLVGSYAQLMMDTNFCMGIIAYKGESKGASPYESMLATLNFVETAGTRHLQESLPALVFVRKMECMALEKHTPEAKGDGLDEMVSREKLIIWITAAYLKGTNVHCTIDLLDANNQSVVKQCVTLHQMCYTQFPQGLTGGNCHLTLDYEGIKQLLSASGQGTFHLEIIFEGIFYIKTTQR